MINFSCELSVDVNLVLKILVKNIILSKLVAVFDHVYTVNISFDVTMTLRHRAGTFLGILICALVSGR